MSTGVGRATLAAIPLISHRLQATPYVRDSRAPDYRIVLSGARVCSYSRDMYVLCHIVHPANNRSKRSWYPRKFARRLTFDLMPTVMDPIGQIS